MPRPLTATEWRGHAAMLSFAILVAGSFSLGGIVANQIDPVAISAMRFVLAACLVGVIALAGPGIKSSDLKAPWRYALMGMAMATYFVLMFEGLKTATPVSMAAVFTLTPILSGFFAWILLRQIMRPAVALWLMIGAIGALWVIFRADLSAFLSFDIGYGEVIFFFGCAAHALNPPLIRKLNRGEHPIVFTFGMLVAGGIILSILGARPLLAIDWQTMPAIVWITLAYVTIFATAGSFFLVQYASLKLPAPKVMAYTYLTPSVVILWEGALNHGWPAPLVLGGVALTILALLGLLRA